MLLMLESVLTPRSLVYLRTGGLPTCQPEEAHLPDTSIPSACSVGGLHLGTYGVFIRVLLAECTSRLERDQLALVLAHMPLPAMVYPCTHFKDKLPREEGALQGLEELPPRQGLL